MKVWGKTGIVLLAVALGGCAMAPGMKMEEPAEIPGGQVVRVTPITMNLLNSLEASRQNQVREVAEEFSVQNLQYLIGPGDVLQITVWDHPELTIPAGSFRDAETSGQKVGDDGYIFYPYVGMVKVAGTTTDQIRIELTRKLSRYIKRPQLDVSVVAFNSQKVYVSGQVKQPGNLPVSDVPMRVADAINAAGGAGEMARECEANADGASTPPAAIDSRRRRARGS